MITEAGQINIDFADVRTIMKGKGDALMGIGVGSGENRAVDAATNAINNPLLDDAKIEGAKGILVNVTGGSDLSLSEYEEILKIITANADKDAIIITGQSIKEATAEEIKVTVIATGFHSDNAKESMLGDEKQNELITTEEWVRMSKGIRKESNGEYLMGRNSTEADLCVPTILREKDKKVAGQENE